MLTISTGGSSTSDRRCASSVATIEAMRAGVDDEGIGPIPPISTGSAHPLGVVDADPQEIDGRVGEIGQRDSRGRIGRGGRRFDRLCFILDRSGPARQEPWRPTRRPALPTDAVCAGTSRVLSSPPRHARITRPGITTNGVAVRVRRGGFLNPASSRSAPARLPPRRAGHSRSRAGRRSRGRS